MADPDLDAEWWAVADVAAYLRVEPNTVHAYRVRGQMPAPEQHYGRTWLWRPSTITAWQATRSPRRAPTTD